MIKDRLGANAVPLQIPIGKEDSFAGMIDLLTMEAILYKDELGVEFERTEIPEDYKEQASEYRELLLETIAEKMMN